MGQVVSCSFDHPSRIGRETDEPESVPLPIHLPAGGGRERQKAGEEADREGLHRCNDESRVSV